MNDEDKEKLIENRAELWGINEDLALALCEENMQEMRRKVASVALRLFKWSGYDVFLDNDEYKN